MTSRIPMMSDLFVGCPAVGAESAVPGVASGSGSGGVGWRRCFWLFESGLVVNVCRFCALYLVYPTGLPMLLSVPASCQCDRWFCHSPHAVRSTYTFTASYGFRIDISVPAHSAYTFLRLVRLPHLRIRSCACARYPLSVLRYLRSPQPAYRATFRINRWVRLNRSERRAAPYGLYGTIFFC
jgi:hypothetical protein